MLIRAEVIKSEGCPVCYGKLTVTQEFPEHNSLPIDAECKNCNQFFDSYHGMGDSVGRVGKFGWGFDAWDEQGYLQAILDIRKELGING